MKNHHAAETTLHRFLKKHSRLETVEFLVSDLNGLLRAKRCPISSLAKIAKEGMFMPLSITVCDVFGSLARTECLVDEGRYHGDPDSFYRLLPETLRIMGDDLAQVFVRPIEKNLTTPYPYDPRTVLETVLSYYQNNGLKPVVAFEFEFYFLSIKDGVVCACTPPFDWPAIKGPQPLSVESMRDQQEMIRRIEQACHRSNVGLSTITSEFDNGQFEANFMHSDNIMRACEDVLYLKQIIRDIAREKGVIASMMAKPLNNSAGSGMHMHASILDKAGKNIFSGAQGRLKLEYAIGGMLTHMPASVALFAPHANSYRRFVKNSFAPIQANWGENNRHVSIRLPSISDDQATRFEHRLAGADVNPFLMAAAILAAAHDGLTNQTMPPSLRVAKGAVPPTEDNLPLRWKEALNLSAKAPLFDRYFPKNFMEVYLTTKKSEEQFFHAKVSVEDIECYLRLF